MNDYHYRQEHEGFVLYKDDTPIQPMTDQVAIAFDSVSGTWHKHGAPELVEEWARQAREKLMLVSPEAANAIVVIRGKLDVEEFNKCIQIHGYVKIFYERLLPEMDYPPELLLQEPIPS